MNVFIITGGAAKGWHALGVYKRAKENYTFDAFAGISVGALFCGMIAMEKEAELDALSSNMSNDEIYIGANPLDEVRHVAFMKSVYDDKPLWEKVQKYFHIADFKHPFTFGFVSRETGLYYSVTPQDFPDDENLQRAILASASFPEIFPAVPDLYMNDPQGNLIHLKHCVDGGVAHVSPLGDVLKYNPDLIFEASCQSLGMWSDTQTDNNIITQTERDISVIQFNMCAYDRKLFTWINDAAKENPAFMFGGKPRTYIPLTTITPSIDMSSLDFNHAKEWMAQGYTDAANFLKAVE